MRYERKCEWVFFSEHSVFIISTDFVTNAHSRVPYCLKITVILMWKKQNSKLLTLLLHWSHSEAGPIHNHNHEGLAGQIVRTLNKDKITQSTDRFHTL